MKKVISIIYIILGIVSFIFGGVTMTNDGGGSFGTSNAKYVSHEYYGGDAYTGIQQAAADGANNVGIAVDNLVDVENAIDDTTDAIAFGLGAILFVFGGYLILNGLNNMPKKKVSPLAETQIESNSEDIQA